MANKERAIEHLYGIQKGIVFYFYKDPDNYIIEKLFRKFDNLCKPKFMHYCYSTNKIKELKGNWIEFIMKKLQKEDYSSAVTCMMTDATEIQLQSSMFRMAISKKDFDAPGVTANMIYFECSMDISWKEIYCFMRSAVEELNYYYISAGYVMATNDLLNPKSQSYGMKELRKYKGLNNIWGTWINYHFRSDLKRGIDGPNVIQILSNDLYKKIGLDKFIQAAKDEILTLAYNENNIRINILGMQEDDDREVPTSSLDFSIEEIEKKLQILYSFLKPIIVKYQKTSLFFRDSEWDEWLSRYEK